MPNSNLHSAERRVPLAVWPLLLLMLLLLIVSMSSVLLISGMRAYAHGQGVWAVAQHRAYHALLAYAISGEEADYRQFRAELAVPLADRNARLELLGEYPDYERVRASLVDGRNAEFDVPALIFTFRLLRQHPLMLSAVETWSRADALVLELDGLGEQVHARYPGGMPEGPARQQLVHQIDSLQERMVLLMRQFGATMSEGAARIERLVLVLLPLFALALLAAGFFIYRVLDRRAQRAAKALGELTTRLEFQASHDMLTGLDNRQSFEAGLSVALRHRRGGGADPVLLYVDLDQFKVINDTCGRAAGDELIRRVALRIREAAGDEAQVARLGGDEFGVLVAGCPAQVALALAGRIRQRIEELRFSWKEKSFAVSASVGVLTMAEEVASVADAMSAADQACSFAKANGGNRVQLYRPEDRHIRRRRAELRWVERLIAALYSDGFTLHAQEIRSLAYRDRAGRSRFATGTRRFELLLRLTEGDGLMVEPMAFIPAAERYGLMPRIDRWVIARACRELAALQAAGHALPVCTVNLSAASAADPQIAAFVGQCLQQHGIAGAHLGIELSETTVAADLRTCTRLMMQLRELGCPVVLDDVGANLATFSCLRELPIDLLKLNPALVRKFRTDPVDYALVEAIQQVCGILGISTVAEGVESEDVLSALALIGVENAQGHHLRRPVPLVQMLAAAPGTREEDVRPAVLAPVGT